MSLLLLVGILWCALTGIAAYNGTWRIWAAGNALPVQLGKHNYSGFFGLYMLPVFAALAVLAVLGPAGMGMVSSTYAPLILLPAALPAALCFIRLPRFMLPRWYKDWLDRGANKDEVGKPEYSSPFTWLRRSKNVHR
ncbi:hypothetical protein [Arthrobacter sp. zg-Y769]|uniref:hypothetical protein n=1 Tax=Arthrobacter sp. zg-Y769 TaxID=2894191 RepID=UPI001E5BF774|nr:hypothetical protein [Arthrobacter sp. zg-Y769]MCC9206329.1 hypothetical protein [Arthrobacter sp. zg-Y769]